MEDKSCSADSSDDINIDEEHIEANHSTYVLLIC